jgi:prolyl-tRNA synthetase
MTQRAIQPTRVQNYAEWYQAVIREADLAEHASVRGCMIIKPWGYAIWERIQKWLDTAIKDTGHHNFYFPLLIPLRTLQEEAHHVEGFATECAVVTHCRLIKNELGHLIPSDPLEEPVVIRPTSEVLIGEAFARWIKSYRDLPILGNQWANVIRWEMRPRLFLRTSEFLWQEGHTAHATEQEALIEKDLMIQIYRQLAEEQLAMPVIVGQKTLSETFPGANITACIEAMMQDGKALQVGTSHHLGQKFSQAFNIRFLSKDGAHEHVWTTSWGVSTRLIGGLIMTHSDDDGLVLPPFISPFHMVILTRPEYHQHPYVQSLQQALLQHVLWKHEPLRVLLDRPSDTPGLKHWHWIKKGVPIRIEIGKREILERTICWAQRDDTHHVKKNTTYEEFLNTVVTLLHTIQNALYQKALTYRTQHTQYLISSQEWQHWLQDGASGWAIAPWHENAETLLSLKNTGITPRCTLPIPFGSCIMTGQLAPMTLFARAY